MKTRLCLSKLAPVFGKADRATFVLLVSKLVRPYLQLGDRGKYKRVMTLEYSRSLLDELLAQKERYHILAFTADQPFSSPKNDDLTSVKFAVSPFYSTGFSPKKLARMIELLHTLKYDEQYALARRVVRRITAANQIRFITEDYGCEAMLEPNSPKSDMFIFVQSGSLRYGEQTLLPNGEVSLLTNPHGGFTLGSRFVLEGDVVLWGYPILNRGRVPVDPSEHRRIFANAASAYRNPVLLSVHKGLVDHLESLASNGNPFLDELEGLFHFDAKYRKVHEIGFGLNPCEDFYLRDNFLANELRIGVHFGLGLTPYTPYHLDISCPHARVIAEIGRKKVDIFTGEKYEPQIRMS